MRFFSGILLRFVRDRQPSMGFWIDCRLKNCINFMTLGVSPGVRGEAGTCLQAVCPAVVRGGTVHAFEQATAGGTHRRR
jgi:hypothetical protein